MTACGSSASSNSAEVGSAERAVSSGDYATAKEIADKLVKKGAKENLSVSDLCRLSIIYMQVYETTDEGEDTGAAIQCYRDAFALQPDSAKSFYSSVPLDQQKYVVLMTALVRTMEHPADVSFDHEEDSDSLYQFDFPAESDSI